MNTSPTTSANHRAKECPPDRGSTGPDPPAADGSSADGPNLRARAAVIMAILLVLFVLSQYNYLFFHSVAELFAIAVGWGVFMLVWSARRFVRSEALVFLGTAYLFIGLIDLVHTLAYKGMGVFPAHLDANPATQLWIAARAMESLSLLMFAAFLDKAVNPFRALFCFAAITAVILAAVFVWPVFPACYVTGSGLTPFKKISEYVICLILAASLAVLFRKRQIIEPRVFVPMAASIGLTIMSELVFSFYVNVYGFSNCVGHVAKIGSFFLVYVALIRSGLTQPYAVLFKQWQQSEMGFRELVEAAPISIMRFDAQGIVTYVNPFHLRTFAAGRHGADFFVGRKIHDLPGIVRAGIGDQIARVLAGETVTLVDVHFPEFTGGHSGYQTIKAVPFIENGAVAGGILMREDATALKRHELLFARALKTTADGFWIVDKNGFIVETNAAAARMTGYAMHALQGMHVSAIDANETPTQTQHRLDALKQAGEGLFESRHRRRDGSLIDVEVSVSLLPEEGDFVAFVRDITEKKRSRERLLLSEEKFARAFHHSPLLMTISALDDGTYLEVNDAFVQATGYARADCIDQTSTAIGLIDPASRQRLKDLLLKDGRAAGEELALCRQDGSPMTCSYWGEIIMVADQPQLLSIALDITARKQADWEREASVAMLQLINRKGNLEQLIREATGLMQTLSGCEAVGIRLKDGDDFPYFETRGFPAAFVAAENHLCATTGDGSVICDGNGNPVLECMCGNVIRGRINPDRPFFTAHGSFWTPSTSDLLASTSEADRQARTRNRCNGEGYESVALIPLRYGEEIFGLMQFNDSRRNCFAIPTIHLFERLASKLAIAIKERWDVETLRVSEERYRELFENAPVGILNTTSGGRILSLNPEMAHILGCASPDEALQRYTDMGEQVYAHPAQRSRLIQMLEVGSEVREFEFEAANANGEAIWLRLDARIRDKQDNGSFVIEGFVTDITVSKQMKRLMEARLHLSAYADTHAVDEILKRTLDEAEQLTGSRIGFFHFVAPDQQTIDIQMWSSRTHSDSCDLTGFDRHYPISQAGVWVDCIRERRPVIHNDYAGLAHRRGLPAGHPPVIRELVVPILRDGSIVAILGVGNKPSDYAAGDIHLVSELASMAWDIVIRRQAENELAESRRALQTLMSNLPGIAFRCNNDNAWTMDYISDGCEALTGYDADDFIDNGTLAFNDIIVPDDRQRVWDEIQAALAANNHYEIEYRISDRDGKQKWVWERGRLVSVPDTGNVVLEGFITDISDRKEAERKVNEANQRLEFLISESPAVVYTYCLAETPRQTFSSQNVERILGWDADHFIGNHEGWKACVHPDDLEGVLAKSGELLARGTLSLDYRFKAAWGEYLWLHDEQRLIHDAENQPEVVGAIWDITRQRQQEAELRRLASAISQAAESVMITEPDGTIVFVNPAFEHITGYPAEEAIGRHVSLLESGVHDRQYMLDMWATVSSGNIWTGQFTNRRKDGTLFTEKGTISPVLNAAGEIVNYVSVKRDVTSELRLQEQLSQAQKMEAIGTLAGGIAHDFNNILFPMVGFSEMLKEDLPADSPLQDYVTDIIAAALRAKDLVQQILAFSRQSNEEKHPIRVQQILKEAIKLGRASLPSSIVVSAHIDSGCPPVLADPTQVHQIIMNLITNAYHAMEATGGRLTIDLDAVVVDNPLPPHRELARGTYVRLRIADTGHGIDPAIHDRIFEPYFTTKCDGKGTGLGLSVIHGIVTACQGHIHFDSEPGQGTTFTVHLPGMKTGLDRPVAVAGDGVIPGGHERILLVDDEAPIINMVKRMLERLGYQVAARTASIEALETFKANPERFDLVVTDMTMPSMTGDRLTQALKQIRPEIPVILCTGFSNQIDPQRAADIGIQGFVFKPILKREIARIIRDVLDGRTADPPLVKPGVESGANAMP